VNVRSALAVIAIPALLFASPAAAKSHSAYHKGKTWTWSFATDTLGIAPPNTKVLGGTWSVLIDSVAAKGAPPRDTTSTPGDSTAVPGDSTAAPYPPTPRVLRQSESDDGVRFHYIEFKKPVLNDMIASVRFRMLSGEMGPSVGILFQLDPKGNNGYLVRVRSDEGDLVAHYLLGGKRRDLKMVKITPPAFGTWHTILVSRKGSVLEASYDGVQLIQIRDERFSKGAVGLWAEDDTVADFSDLTLTTQ
jgi:hypothetical protein